MAEPATVSVVIPTRNGIDTLPALLDQIAAQEAEATIEVVAIDSGSTDGSAELLARRADVMLALAPREFNHGLTRNRAIDAASGALVVLMVQDAVPASSRWLAELVAPFAHDPGLAGAFARQLPRPDASRVARRALAGWVAAGSEPRVSSIEDVDAFNALPPMERFLTCVFDNVCSCVRRSVWQQHPFPEVPIAEDLAWAQQVLLAGHRLAYVPSAEVVHSHKRSLAAELERTMLCHRQLRRLFDLRTIPGLTHLVRAWAVTVLTHLRWLAEGPGPTPGARGVARALGLAFAWPLGQYLGGRD